MEDIKILQGKKKTKTQGEQVAVMKILHSDLMAPDRNLTKVLLSYTK